MSEVAHENVKKYVSTCVIAFVAVLVLTGVSVGAYYAGLSTAKTVGVIAGLAFVQGLLVAGYFMDLFAEKKLIFWVLLFTAIFFVGCLFLPVGQYLDRLDTGHVS